MAVQEMCSLVNPQQMSGSERFVTPQRLKWSRARASEGMTHHATDPDREHLSAESRAFKVCCDFQRRLKSQSELLTSEEATATRSGSSSD